MLDDYVSKGPDQTVQMHGLIWAFAVRICPNPSLAEHDMPLANSVDPDQLASEEAN